MTAALRFDQIRLPPECEILRREVREFLAEEIAAGTFNPHEPQREDTDIPEFSHRVGARGWIGMTWPKKYGGHERTFLERFVVTEEMRIANAPTRRFFVADRQSGPVLLKFANEKIKTDILPRICRGEVCFSIGMSEPNSGSDLASLKTKAVRFSLDQRKSPSRPDSISCRHENSGNPRQSDCADQRIEGIQ